MEYITRTDERSIDLRGAAFERDTTDMIGGLVAGLTFGQARIVTGMAMGPARIIVDRRDEHPGETVDGWEDIVELSCRTTGDLVIAVGPYADAPDPRFAVNPPGAEWFRIRVHGRNRDLMYDLVSTSPHEEYLLTAWPESPSAPIVLSTGSNVARQLSTASTTTSPVATISHQRPNRHRDKFTELPADAHRREQAEKNLLRIARRNKKR